MAADGTKLEAEALWPTATVAGVAVLSHPHPLYGGDMWNPLVDHLFTALPAKGIATLRYNFRGVGRSDGRHDDGIAEQLDATAAFEAAVELASNHANGPEFIDSAPPPVVSAGWSFGGDVSLAADHDHLTAWIAIAAPLRIVDPTAMTAPNDPRPKLLLVPEHDQFRSPTEAAELTSSWTNMELAVIKRGDHFLMGQTTKVAEMIADFVTHI